MHRLKSEAAIIAFIGQNALGAEQILPLAGQHLRDPGVETLRINRAIHFEGNAVHFRIMFVIILARKEFRFAFQNARQVEGIAPDHGADRHIGFRGATDFGIGVDGADALFHFRCLSLSHQIHLVQHNDVGEGDLFLRFGGIRKARGQMLGINHGHNRIQLRRALHIIINEEGLRHRGGVGQARGFHDNAIKLVAPLHQPAQDADQITAHRAADAAIVHLKHFFIGIHDQVVIHAQFAEFIDHHGEFLAVVFGQDAVQQRGLAGTKIAGQHGHGHGGAGGVAHVCLSVKRIWPLYGAKPGRGHPARQSYRLVAFSESPCWTTWLENAPLMRLPP